MSHSHSSFYFLQVLVADPDWEPEPPFSRLDLDFRHMAFQFKIFDRNAHTTRMSEWLVLHRPGLYFSYRLHEQLRVPDDPNLKSSKFLPWSVREVEVAGRKSWHNSQVDHGHSQSFNRYLFDLNLLEQDRRETPDEAHVLYYLGATNFAALEARLGRGEHSITPEMTNFIDSGIKYLELRLKEHHVLDPLVSREQTWAAMRWLAYAFQNFRVSFEQSEHWYLRCIEFDPPRADCPVFLSKLYRTHGKTEKSWPVISEALKSPPQERRFSNNFYIYQCSLPLEASLTLIELLSSEVDVGIARVPSLLFGWKLLRAAQKACVSPSLGFLLDSEEDVAAAEAAYRALASGGSPESPLDLLDRDELCVESDGTGGSEQMKMLRTWGVSVCSESRSSP